MKRRLHLVARLIMLTLALTPRLAFAHAGLRDADPAPGSTVVGSPAEIRLAFDEALAPGSAFVVYASAFQAVPGIAPMIEGASLRAIPAAPFPPRPSLRAPIPSNGKPSPTTGASPKAAINSGSCHPQGYPSGSGRRAWSSCSPALRS